MVVGQDSGNVSPGECGADRFTGLIDCGLVGLGVGGLLAVAAPVKEKAIVRTNSVFNIQIFLHSRTSTVRTTLAILPSLPSDGPLGSNGRSCDGLHMTSRWIFMI